MVSGTAPTKPRLSSQLWKTAASSLQEVNHVRGSVSEVEFRGINLFQHCCDLSATGRR